MINFFRHELHGSDAEARKDIRNNLCSSCLNSFQRLTICAFFSR